jgi:hypothetical protein
MVGKLDCIGQKIPDDLLQALGVANEDAADIIQVAIEYNALRIGCMLY